MDCEWCTVGLAVENEALFVSMCWFDTCHLPTATEPAGRADARITMHLLSRGWDLIANLVSQKHWEIARKIWTSANGENSKHAFCPRTLWGGTRKLYTQVMHAVYFSQGNRHASSYWPSLKTVTEALSAMASISCSDADGIRNAPPHRASHPCYLYLLLKISYLTYKVLCAHIFKTGSSPEPMAAHSNSLYSVKICRVRLWKPLRTRDTFSFSSLLIRNWIQTVEEGVKDPFFMLRPPRWFNNSCFAIYVLPLQST